MNEHQHQAALFRWRDGHVAQYPALDTLYAVPNGGRRSPATARYMKDEGLQAGVPDLHLPVARVVDGKLYHSLYIELKVGNNRPSPVQRAWHARLAREGHLVLVIYHWETARDTLVAYLTGRPLPDPQAKRTRPARRARLQARPHPVHCAPPPGAEDAPL
jgi:hypothetical protein